MNKISSIYKNIWKQKAHVREWHLEIVSYRHYFEWNQLLTTTIAIVYMKA